MKEEIPFSDQNSDRLSRIARPSHSFPLSETTGMATDQRACFKKTPPEA